MQFVLNLDVKRMETCLLERPDLLGEETATDITRRFARELLHIGETSISAEELLPRLRLSILKGRSATFLEHFSKCFERSVSLNEFVV